jgi:hypothetical protein
VQRIWRPFERITLCKIQTRFLIHALISLPVRHPEDKLNETAVSPGTTFWMGTDPRPSISTKVPATKHESSSK